MDAGPSVASHTALVVMNGRARGATATALRRAVTVLERGYRVRVETPETHTALIEVVACATEELIVAVGGDGTVNAVVGALPPHAAIAVLPIGTANDFAGEIGVPSHPDTAAEVLVSRRDEAARQVDLVRVNGHPFCTVGGIGLVARTTAAVAAAKQGRGAVRAIAQRLGGTIYQLAAASTILAGRDLVEVVDIEFTAPDGTRGEWRGGVEALFVVNHRRCGGGLVLPVPSSGADGVFELGLVTARSRPALAANFLRLARGAAIPPGILTVLPAIEATVRVQAPVTFAADGELLATGQEFHLTIDRGALRLRGVP